jgi:hypothetical protein
MRSTLLTLLTLAFLAAPRVAWACPMCFGENNSPMTAAMKAGIVFMLIIVAGVLGGFASFFIYLIRRAKRVAEQEGTV